MWTMPHVLLRDPLRSVQRFVFKPKHLSPIQSQRVQSVLSVLGGIPPVREAISAALINRYTSATAPRPRPFSMAGDYTSWRSLTDRTFTGRHLPAAPEGALTLPPEAQVNELFRRERFAPATDTSVLFMFFAQWFTDSFLRTDRSNPAKNTSNHAIDLCQIYGLDEQRTRMLRADTGGLLRSQFIDGAEYPEFLFDQDRPDLTTQPHFEGLHDAAAFAEILEFCPPANRRSTFAVGLEHGNSTIGHAMFNVIFLREHNRIARIIAAAHPEWDNDRVFETTRNVLIVLLLKVVVEDYIMHIGPFEFPLTIPPFIAEQASWNRTNWMSIEFNLLYRWHSLVPDAIGELGPLDFLSNNPMIVQRGVGDLLALCSRTRAGRIGLGNTPAFLVDRTRPEVPSVTEKTTTHMRQAHLPAYNDYRKAFGLEEFRSFDELTADPQLRARLSELYGTVDNLEWYVGIFAEDYPRDYMMGELMTVMVAYDAFTQALTNPLLARNVYTPQTFSDEGWQIIEQTSSLRQIVARNTGIDQALVSFRVRP